jgi:nucleoside-diphosphate-sugar epimerase
MQGRVLITGINGFAGHYVSAHLAAEGYQIFGTAHADLTQSADRVYNVNLLDAPALNDVVSQVQPTHVVHLAAVSSVTHGNVAEIYDTNIVGTSNLLKALSRLTAAPISIILASSANVYGNSTKGVLSEVDDVNPANDYAVSKIAMEYMSRQFAENLNLITVRPFNYTGRGQTENFLIPKIVNHFRSRKSTIELGNIEVSRDFSDVRMVTKYIGRLLASDKAIDQVYNICSGRPFSLGQIIAYCEQVTGHKIEVRINPDFVRANEIRSLVGNPEKIQAAVGNVSGFNIEETLSWMLSA